MASEDQKAMTYWDSLAFEVESKKTIDRTEKWRQAARNWLAHYAERKARNFVKKTVKDHVKLKKGAKVLDVGCGVGKWVDFFAQRGFMATGIDSSPWMIRVAKQNVNERFKKLVSFYVMNVASLELPSDSYDMVNCITVLQHIFDDEEWANAVREIVRVTKPLGYILIFEAAPSFAFNARTRHMCLRTMKQYVRTFAEMGAHFSYWKATDISFPITSVALRRYAASFDREVYYFSSKQASLLSADFLSFLSKMASTVAELIDYRLSDTPLGFLSIGKIMLFRKTR